MYTVSWILGNGYCNKVDGDFQISKDEWNNMTEDEQEHMVSDDALGYAEYGWRYSSDGTEVVFWNRIDAVGCDNEYHEPSSVFMGLSEEELETEARESAFNDFELTYAVSEEV